MTISEFQAWLKGFAEGIGDRPPTKQEWDKIIQKASGVHESSFPVGPSQPSPLPWRSPPFFRYGDRTQEWPSNTIICGSD